MIHERPVLENVGGTVKTLNLNGLVVLYCPSWLLYRSLLVLVNQTDVKCTISLPTYIPTQIVSCADIKTRQNRDYVTLYSSGLFFINCYLRGFKHDCYDVDVNLQTGNDSSQSMTPRSFNSNVPRQLDMFANAHEWNVGQGIHINCRFA